MSEGELDRMLAPLAGDDADARKTAAEGGRRARSRTPSPAITKKLAELRKASSASVAAAVRQTQGSRQARPSRAPTSATRCSRCQSGRRSARREDGASSPQRSLRALAHTGTTPAVRQLVKVAGDSQRRVPSEITRQVKALGDKAIPALIETRKESVARGPSLGVQRSSRRWASASPATPSRRRTTRSSPTCSMPTAPSTTSTPCRSFSPSSAPIASRSATAARESLTQLRSGRRLEAARGVREPHRQGRARGLARGRGREGALRRLRPRPPAGGLRPPRGGPQEGEGGQARRGRCRLRQGPRAPADARSPRARWCPPTSRTPRSSRRAIAPRWRSRCSARPRASRPRARASHRSKAEIAYLEGKELARARHPRHRAVQARARARPDPREGARRARAPRGERRRAPEPHAHASRRRSARAARRRHRRLAVRRASQAAGGPRRLHDCVSRSAEANRRVRLDETRVSGCRSVRRTSSPA